MDKPRLSFWQIWNMSFGFMGIQFGWGLQMANMSAIYEYLGASESEIPLLWLAAPVTGLLVQPVVGYYSDRTWTGLGRRKPYFLVGALLASGALVLMPHSSALWMAAGLLWILDTSVNISMEPFRAFVADILPEEQHKSGFAMQGLLIGIGAVASSALPWVLTNVFGFVAEDGHGVPLVLKIAFTVGALVLFLAVLVTVLTTREYPPADLEAFARMKAEGGGPLHLFGEIFRGIRDMPRTMAQLAWVQFFTWLCLFCMWLFFTIAVAEHVFQATPGQPAYQRAVEWGGVCFAVYNGTAFVFSFLLLWLVGRASAKAIHFVCLLLGGGALVSVSLITNQYLLLMPMIAVGIAWASILSMPYAMLAGCLPPEKMGFYMGVFNFFIVLPQIVASVGLSYLMDDFHIDRMTAVVLGGVSMILAAFLVLRVQTNPETDARRPLGIT